MITIYYDGLPHTNDADSFNITENYNMYVKYKNYHIIYIYNCRAHKLNEYHDVEIDDKYCAVIINENCDENIFEELEHVFNKLSDNNFYYHIPKKIDAVDIKNNNFFSQFEQMYSECDIYDNNYNNITPKKIHKQSSWKILKKYLNFAKFNSDLKNTEIKNSRKKIQ
jgi:hypothetical protein